MPLTYAEFMDSVRGGTIASAGVTVTPQFANYLGENPAYAQQLFQWWDGTGQAPTDLSGMAVPEAAAPDVAAAAPAAPASALASSGPMPGFGSGPAAGATTYTPYVPASNTATPPWTSQRGPLVTYKQQRGNPVTSMVIGYGMALLGVAITVVSYLATSAGGTYVVSWGLIVVGLINGIRGTVRYLRR